jgi:hypothetical protein
VVSVALNVTGSAVASLTAKTACPFESVTTEVGETTAVPEEAVSVTDFPSIALTPSAANNVTVTAPEGCTPPLATDETTGSVVVTVDALADAVSVPNVTEALCPLMAIPSVVSVAV